MAGDVSRPLPVLRYARAEDGAVPEDKLTRALRLAREIEELLEDTRSIVPAALTAEAQPQLRGTSSRMARAVAASLVDELEGLVRSTQKAGAA